MRLSLILPCYNVAQYLPKCLDSIFENECFGVEVVLINDGSSDDIGGLNKYFNQNKCNQNIVFEYKNAQIKIIHTCNQGVSSARNTGIENATGDYIIFIDPDDMVRPNYFSSVKNLLETANVDIGIFGFHQIVEDENGRVIEEKQFYPQKKYTSNSVEETVANILPKYLGYSIEDVLKWANSKEAISKRLEWGAVWRNIYRKNFINENSIRFSPSIRLNEDSMFNATCFSVAKNVKSFDECFYCYTIRPTGAFMKNRSASLVKNKTALLEERSRIVNDLRKRGFDFSVEDYAGSNVMSCFELIIKMPFSARNEPKKYIRNPIVKESTKRMPFTGRKKVDIPLFALKCNFGMLMIDAVNLGKILGFHFHL